MKIANRIISYDTAPLIIAELGINHGGDLSVAKKMVDLASTSGCEIIKHQTHFLEDEMTHEAKEIFPPNANMSIWEVMEKCALSKEDEIELKKHAGVREAPFFGLPSLDIGTRQNLRNQTTSIFNATAFETKQILDFLNTQWGKKYKKDISFGIGNSSENFKKILAQKTLWELPLQKTFFDGF